MFFNSGASNIKVPDSVTAIGGYAFYNCDNLETISIPENVKSIGNHAFRECRKLTSVKIPDAVETIERECFWGCVGIKEIILPKNLKKIEEKAFSGCISVSEIKIPDGTEVIEDGVFWGDKNLAKITIPGSVRSIGEMAFCSCGKLKIYGEKGSYAEKYALENEISFCESDRNEDGGKDSIPDGYMDLEKMTGNEDAHSATDSEELKCNKNPEAEALLKEIETQFTSDKRQWESFAREVPKRFNEAIRKSMSHSISRNPSTYSGGQRTLSFSLQFDTNKDVLENFVDNVKKEIDEKSGLIKEHIDKYDGKLRELLVMDIEPSLMGKMAGRLADWINYALNLHLEIRENKDISIPMPDNYPSLMKEWKHLADKKDKEAEAKKLGVSLEDLDRHKEFIDICRKKDKAATSSEMIEIEKRFRALNGYLNSDELAWEAHAAVACLQEKEERKAEEEEKKRQQEERERNQYYKDLSDWKSKCEQIEKERTCMVEEELKAIKDEIEKELRKKYDPILEKLKGEIKEQEDRLSAAETKLTSLGLFKISEKKEQKAIIEDARNKIDAGREELSRQEYEYRNKLSGASDTAKKEKDRITAKINEQLVLPAEPVKPAVVLADEKR